MAFVPTVQTLTETDLKCSRCLIVMVPPIYCCQSKHSYCKDCQLENNICTICPPIQPINLQNDDLEAMSKTAIHRCRWNELCGRFRYDEIRAHEYPCGFRNYLCPYCYISIDLKHMIDHGAKAHPSIEFIESHICESTQKVDRLCVMVVYQEIFVCEVTIKPEGVVWIVHIPSGPISRAKDFHVYLYAGKKYRSIPICHKQPTFELELPNSQLPTDGEFTYYVNVLPSS